MIPNCGGLGFGELEGTFIASLMPVLQLVIPLAHLLTHVFVLRHGNRTRELESLSIRPR